MLCNRAKCLESRRQEAEQRGDGKSGRGESEGVRDGRAGDPRESLQRMSVPTSLTRFRVALLPLAACVILACFARFRALCFARAIFRRLRLFLRADDSNSDQKLDRDECKKLLKESLIEQKKYVPKIIDVIVDSGLEVNLGCHFPSFRPSNFIRFILSFHFSCISSRAALLHFLPDSLARLICLLILVSWFALNATELLFRVPRRLR